MAEKTPQSEDGPQGTGTAPEINPTRVDSHRAATSGVLDQLLRLATAPQEDEEEPTTPPGSQGEVA